ncbi:MAG: DUF4350 domain-containing protein [Fimbriimonas sp.]
MNRWFLTFVIGLLGLIGMSALLSQAGKRDDETWPSADHDGPSGASALRTMLVQRGFRVRVDRASSPLIGPKDLAIVFTNRQSFGVDEAQVGKDEKLQAYLRRKAEAGGTILVLPLLQNFNGARPEATTVTDGIDRDPVRVSMSPALFESSETWMPGDARTINLWYEDTEGDPDEAEWFATVGVWGKGQIAELRDGIGATNRHLAKLDNASVVLSVVRGLSRPQGEIVFVEASFGGANTSLLALIGPWAQAAWWQVLFVFALLVYTLGQRFGLPDEVRAKQVATREFIDAVADTMLRARAGSMVLRLALRRADHDLRGALRLGVSAERGRRDEQLPESLASILQRAEAALSMPDLPWARAVELARQVDRATSDFLRNSAKRP